MTLLACSLWCHRMQILNEMESFAWSYLSPNMLLSLDPPLIGNDRKIPNSARLNLLHHHTSKAPTLTIRF